MRMAASAATERNATREGGLQGLSARIRSYYSEVRNEMKKVTAPSWKEVRSTTVVVLVTVAFFGVFFFAVDAVLSRVVGTLIDHFSK